MRLEEFDAGVAEATTTDEVWQALMILTRAHLPAKLFTIMEVDLDAMLARRAFTSHPKDYPASGTKPIEMNPWFDQVVGRGEVFTAQTLDEIAQVFPDHELIGALGCGAVLNLPLRAKGRIAATLNILDIEGSYPAEAVTRAVSLQDAGEYALQRVYALTTS